MGGLFIGLLLLAILAASTAISQKIIIPDPVLITVVGIFLGFVPGFPPVRLDPDLVLTVILPPLVYSAAAQLPWEEFRANLRPISLFAVGLVLFTAVVVAAVAHALIPNLSWAEAFVLGAIVSPTDPVASTAVTQRLGAPRRLVAIIEGEGLVNDAVALTLVRLASAAVVSGAYSFAAGAGRFALIVAGEPAYGLFVGWIAALLRKRTDDSRVEIAISLLTPFAAYLVPVMLGGSGVLAALSAGMYIGALTPELVPSGIRLHLTSVWAIVVYLLNGFLFLLTGLELHDLARGPGGFGGSSLLAWGAIISAVVIVLRYVWTLPAAWATNRMAGSSELAISGRQFAFLASCGMRGGISLAAALSLTAAVPSRSLIIFITACVIAATLILQGSPLPLLLRKLRLDVDAREENRRGAHTETEARATALRAAIKSLADAGPDAERLKAHYEDRLKLLAEGGEVGETAPPNRRERLIRIQLQALSAERNTVVKLFRSGKIPEYVLHRIERDLDLTEVRLKNLLPDAVLE